MTPRERTIALIRARKAQKLQAPRARMPRAQFPTTIQLDYYRAIEPIVVRTRNTVRSKVYPVVKKTLEGTRTDAQDYSDVIVEVANELGELLKPSQLEEVAGRFGHATSEFQREQLNRQVRAAMGVDLSAIEPNIVAMVDDFAKVNAALIKTIPQQCLDSVGLLVSSGVETGVRWESLAEEIEVLFGVTENRAKVIARDQVGKFYGELNQKRQENLGITGYTWRTSNDNRVRDEHELREGVRFEWSDPPGDGHPGEPVLCRCYAEPDVDSILRELRGS